MMKVVWAAVLLAFLGAAIVQAQQELSPVELVESGSSSGVSGVDSGIIYDGGFLEIDAEADGELEEEELFEQDNDDAALIEIEADNDAETENTTETEADAETETEADQSADEESADRSLLEKAKPTKAKAGAKAGKPAAKAAKAAKGAKQAKAPKAPKAPKAKAPKPAQAPKVEKTLPAPASDAKAIVQTGRGRKGRNCRGSRCRRRKHGHGIAPAARRRVQQRLPAPRLTGAAATLTRANVRCVLCQFITQRLKNGLTGADEAASTSLIEAFAFASAGAQSRAESAVSAAAYADASAAAIPSLFDHGADAPRRFRHTDILAHRAARARFTQQRSGAAQTAEQEEQRAAYLKLYSTVYASFEDLCAKKMPLAYLPYCNDMLKSYRFFAQGINYADRPEQICMNGNFCDHRSYVRRVTHNTYQREPGDA